MSVLQLNLQLSNMECIQMNLKLCFTSLFSVICTLLAKMAKKFQIIMSAYVNIIQTQSEELRLQAKGSVSLAKREMVFIFKSKNKICEDGNERHQFRLMV